LSHTWLRNVFTLQLTDNLFLLTFSSRQIENAEHLNEKKI